MRRSILGWSSQTRQESSWCTILNWENQHHHFVIRGRMEIFCKCSTCVTIPYDWLQACFMLLTMWNVGIWWHMSICTHMYSSLAGCTPVTEIRTGPSIVTNWMTCPWNNDNGDHCGMSVRLYGMLKAACLALLRESRVAFILSVNSVNSISCSTILITT